MRPTATDRVVYVVCLCACLLVTFAALQKRLNLSRFPEVTRMSPRSYILDGVEIPHEKGKFWGLSGPLNSTGCLAAVNAACRRDSSVLNIGVILPVGGLPII